MNKSGSTASGKYQILWKAHSNDIKQVTGISTQKEFLNSPEAQEKYMDHLIDKYSNNLPKFKSNYPGASDEVYMAMEHFLGFNDANLYLSAYKTSKNKGASDVEAHSMAQDKLNSLYKERYNYVPKNLTVLEYLRKFTKGYNK